MFCYYFAGFFDQMIADVSSEYSLEITPMRDSYYVWVVVFTWLAAWILYAHAAICRRAGDTYLYELPVFPVAEFAFFIASNAFIIGWLFAWDREELAVSLLLVFVATIFAYVSLVYSVTSLADNVKSMFADCLRTDVWVIRALAQNGIGFYTAWLTITFLLNLGMVLTYQNGELDDIAFDADVSSTIILSIIALEDILFAVGIFFWDDSIRYLVAPYIANVIKMAFIVDNNYDLDDAYTNSIFSLILLIVAGILLVFKAAVMIYRHMKKKVVPECTPSTRSDCCE